LRFLQISLGNVRFLDIKRQRRALFILIAILGTALRIHVCGAIQEDTRPKRRRLGWCFFASGMLINIHQKRSKKIPPSRQRALANDNLANGNLYANYITP
jgi:hypothetical protein